MFEIGTVILHVPIGLSNFVVGYKSLHELPIRATAAQHIISVVGQHCQVENPIVSII